MSLKIYVAAPWSCKDEAKIAAEKLNKAGHEITSRWLDTVNSDDPVTLRENAVNDLEDVLASDIFVLLNTKKSEGKAVEMGVALMASATENLPMRGLFLVGEFSNIFTRLLDKGQRKTIEEVIEDLKKLGGTG